MKMSAKSRYGILGLIEIYKSGSKMSISEIAQKHKISNKFLESCFADLKKGRILTSRAGANGGYLPAKSPDDVTLYDIILCLEGSISIADNDFDGSSIKNFIFENYWNKINTDFENFLKNRRLSDYIQS